MISWAMDKIDRWVNPDKFDINSIKNNRYGQWDEKEDIVATDSPTPGFISANALVSAQMQKAQNNYQQVLGQQAYTATSVQGLWAQTGTGTLSQAVYMPSGGYPITLPAPTGNTFTISFVDASGINYPMVIDQAYVTTMQQISQAQQPRGWPASSPFTPPPPSKMVDGEFSLDEMGVAEEIIMELDSAH